MSKLGECRINEICNDEWRVNAGGNRFFLSDRGRLIIGMGDNGE